MQEELILKDKESTQKIPCKILKTRGNRSGLFYVGEIPSARSNFGLCKTFSNSLFLNGGCDEKSDFNDTYSLDLSNSNLAYKIQVSLEWKKIDLPLKSPYVGHTATCLYRSLNNFKPYVYLFGGWEGASYSQTGILVDPKTWEVQFSTNSDNLISWDGMLSTQNVFV